MNRSLVLGLGVLAACGSRASAPVGKVPPVVPAIPSAVVEAAPPVPGLRLPDGVTPRVYDLRLEVDPDADAFRGRVEITVAVAPGTRVIWLHASDLTIASAAVREGTRTTPVVPLPGDASAQLLGLQLARPAAGGELVLALEFSGHTTRDQAGLFRQKANGRWYLFAQSEAVFARRFLPCFDEPRFKAQWRVTLVVPGDLVALANAPVSSERSLPDGRREVTFAEIGPLPTYLVSVAVGPFTLVDGGRIGRSQLPLRFAVPAADARKMTYAKQVVPKIAAALERYLDGPLPWPKLDLVAVPALFGAMEHPGLVTFDHDILVGEPRDAEYQRELLHVTAHELAHQWFGNTVTHAWWDELWLTESLASFVGDKIAAELGAFPDAVLHAYVDRGDALAAERLASPRALRQTIASTADIEDTFGEIAYEKGSAVLAMFEHVAGVEPFRAALRAYVRAHVGGTVTADDLVRALAEATSPALAASLAGYGRFAGMPVVDLALRCTGSTAVLAAHARSGMTVPVCVRYATATGAARTCALVGDRTEVALAACPRWTIGNAGALGYYRVAGLPVVPAIAAATPVERFALADDVIDGVLAGELPAPDALRTLEALAAARDGYAQLAALAIARALDPLVDDAQRPRWTAWLEVRLRARLTSKAILAARSPLDVALRDAIVELLADHVDAATVRRTRALVDRALSKGGSPTPALALALSLAAPRGGTALFDAILAAATDPERAMLGRELLSDLASFGPALAPRVVGTLLDARYPADRVVRSVIALLASPGARTATWRALRDALPRVLRRLSPREGRELIEATGSLCEATARAEVVASVAPHVGGLEDGQTALTTALAAIDRCVERRAAVKDLALP